MNTEIAPGGSSSKGVFNRTAGKKTHSPICVYNKTQPKLILMEASVL